MSSDSSALALVRGSEDLLSADLILVAAYAPKAIRRDLNLLWRLDARLAKIALYAPEALLARIKLQWWAEQLQGLTAERPLGEPLLAALAETNFPPELLAELAFAWQELVNEQPPDDDEWLGYATKRGRSLWLLLGACQQLCGELSEDLMIEAKAYALVQIAQSLPQNEVRQKIMALVPALPPLGFYPKELRHLGILAIATRRDMIALKSDSIANEQSASRAILRVARFLWHRLCGR